MHVWSLGWRYVRDVKLIVRMLLIHNMLFNSRLKYQTYTSDPSLLKERRILTKKASICQWDLSPYPCAYCKGGCCCSMRIFGKMDYSWIAQPSNVLRIDKWWRLWILLPETVVHRSDMNVLDDNFHIQPITPRWANDCRLSHWRCHYYNIAITYYMCISLGPLLTLGLTSSFTIRKSVFTRGTTWIVFGAFISIGSGLKHNKLRRGQAYHNKVPIQGRRYRLIRLLDTFSSLEHGARTWDSIHSKLVTVLSLPNSYCPPRIKPRALWLHCSEPLQWVDVNIHI